MIGPIIGILIPFATFARFLKSGPAPFTNFFPAAPKKPKVPLTALPTGDFAKVLPS